MKLAKEGASAAKTVSEVATFNATELFYRFVSPPLAATTAVSGTLKSILMFSSASSDYGYCYAYVMQPDGSVRGSVSGPFDQNNTEGLVITSTETGRNFGNTSPFFTLTSVTPVIGDRLVIEVGTRSGSVSAHNASIRAGGTGSDLTSGSTDTTLPGWFEYSATLTFNPEPSGGRAFILW